MIVGVGEFPSNLRSLLHVVIIHKTPQNFRAYSPGAFDKKTTIPKQRKACDNKKRKVNSIREKELYRDT